MMNTLTRRSMLGHSTVALIGGAGLAFAVPDMEARATAAHDPMLAFLNEWEGMERVAESIPAKDDDWVARYLVPLDQRVADGDVLRTPRRPREPPPPCAGPCITTTCQTSGPTS